MRFLLSAFLVLLLVPLSAYADGQSNCSVCHNEMSGKATVGQVEVDLKVELGKFQESVHGFLTCADCHLKFSEDPHVSPGEEVSPDVAALAEKIRAKAHVDPVALAACRNCHGDIYESVLGSVHGRNITDKGNGDGALCLDCHGSPHYINAVAQDASSPANRENVVKTCGGCHGSDEILDRYGINHNVMDSYYNSFHGKKFTLGHSNAPTCANCHGYHNVLRSDNPGSPMFDGNKIETCGTCHKGANKKFVAAITHKEPGPIPHYSELLLIVLTLSVFAFIILHVIFEAFSDIRDTFFRKHKEVENGGSE